MKIITKALTRADLYEIIFKLEPVSIDLTIVEEFSKAKKEAVEIVALLDLQGELDKLPIHLPEINAADEQEFTAFFSRAYHLFLLLTALKNKSKVRLQVAEFLVALLNHKIKCSNYFPKPYSVLYSFYGESAISAIVASSELPRLTNKEKEVLVPAIENAFYFALSTVNLFKTQNTMALSEIAFALFLEQNSIKPDFLQVKYEKRNNNKFVSPTANNVLNLISGSKYTKTVPSNVITTWIDLVATVKAVVLESLNSILEEVNTEENENLKELNIKDENYNAKNVLFFNTQSLNLLTGINAVIQNNFARLREVKDVEKELSSNLDLIQAEFAKNREKLFNVLCSAGQNIGFGSTFGPMIYAADFIRILYESVLIEALGAFRTLEAQNLEIVQKSSKGKPEETKDPEADKKTPRKIQLGKGTIQVYGKFDDEFSSKVNQKILDKDGVLQFSEYFTPFNLALQELIEELISPKNSERRKPKIPKGTRDMEPLQMTIRRMAINQISAIFRKHGAVEIDTPVFELRETLTGKYGEASKLIYDLNDQGGEQLSLRYDLTVPFARYLALKGETSLKRLHIAKVYRRDQPQLKKGRFREFYQCDYDIVGNYGVMIPDAECIMILSEIFTTLALGKVIIKINHRKLLDAMVELSGAPKQKFKSICSSIDKLDKETWEDVKKELITEKGLTEQMANKLGEFVQYKGSPLELYERLTKEEVFKGSKEGEAALKEMGILFKYLTDVNCTEGILFDLSLARGLDYYTGIIYEAVLDDSSVGLGSIAGGGRYDELVGMFSNKDLPAVGLSIGIERIFGLLEKKYETTASIRACETEVLVASIGSGMASERFKLCKLLWDNGIKAEMLYNENPKTENQLKYALKNYIPFILWIGGDEIKNNKVNVKCLYKAEENAVNREDLVKNLKESLKIYAQDVANGLVEFKKVEEKEGENKEGEAKGKGREQKGKGKEEKTKEKQEK